MAKRESQGDYKRRSLPEKTRAQRTFMWRKRIEQSKVDLMIPARVQNAREADRFLGGNKSVPKRGRGGTRVYLNYALPLLEELHRGSIPSIPAPTVEARTEAAAGKDNIREQSTQRFLNFIFDKNDVEILKALNSIQWDDDKMGASILRVDWQQQTVDADPTSEIAQENVDIQVRRAAEENLDVTKQVITDSDLDVVHIPQHQKFLATLDPASDQYRGLDQHIREHTTRLSVVTQEGVRVSRVRNDRYFYDQYHGWESRGWEAELKFARAKFLIDNGYKNVTPDNAPPRQSNEGIDGQGGLVTNRQIGDGEIAYEDRTIAIYEIHDRLNKREIVLAADGPEDGRPLMERPWRYGELDIYKLKPFHSFEPTLSWGEPLMHVMNPILNELALVDYYIQRHVQNHPVPKLLVTGNSSANKIKKALRDPNQSMVEIPIEAGKPTVFDPPAIPQTLLAYRDSLINELRRAVGLDSQDVGAERPGQITATESFARSQAGAGRIEDRQKVIAEFLSWIGEMSLKLYKDFAMMATEISVNTDIGQEWITIEPRDLPVDIGISFEIESVTDRGRAENLARVNQVIAIVRGSLVPHDDEELTSWALKEMGVKRSERFRARGRVGPENVMETPGQPGIEGSSQAPVGTSLNERANSEFAPNPSDAAAAVEASGQTVA